MSLTTKRVILIAIIVIVAFILERHFWQPVLSLMRSRPVTRHT